MARYVYFVPLFTSKLSPGSLVLSFQQFLIHTASCLANLVPRMSRGYIVTNFLSFPFQFFIQIALKICLKRICQIRRITGLKHVPSLSFDDVFAERTHIRSYHWQSVGITHEQHSTLKNILVGQDEGIRCFKV